MKCYVQILQKGSEAEQFVVWNLPWSGVYLISNFSNNLLQKVLSLVPLTVTGTEVSVNTISTFLFNPYDALEETITHMKSLKIKIYPGENVTDLCAKILVDSERLESAGDLNPEQRGYITRIFEDSPDSRFCV